MVFSTEMGKEIAMSHFASSLCWFIGYEPGHCRSGSTSAMLGGGGVVGDDLSSLRSEWRDESVDGWKGGVIEADAIL